MTSQNDARLERIKQALRANLQRRKEKSRALKQQPPASGSRSDADRDKKGPSAPDDSFPPRK